MAENQIGTLVFLDLESTSLPSPGVYPCITEISLVAVHRNNFDLKAPGVKLPRVLNKLSVCVHPRKPMQSTAALLTGIVTFII